MVYDEHGIPQGLSDPGGTDNHEHSSVVVKKPRSKALVYETHCLCDPIKRSNDDNTPESGDEQLTFNALLNELNSLNPDNDIYLWPEGTSSNEGV